MSWDESGQLQHPLRMRGQEERATIIYLLSSENHGMRKILHTLAKNKELLSDHGEASRESH